MSGTDTYLEAMLRDTNPDNLNWNTQRIWRAMTLAPNIGVFEALLANQDVPITALDQTWAKRFGLIR